MDAIDYENFNFDQCYQKIVGEITRPNILVCGASRTGKSSLVNRILNLPKEDEAIINEKSEFKTGGIKEYSSDSIKIYDCEGYGVGNGKIEDYEKNILSFITKRNEAYRDEFDRQIHEVWYCISAADERILDVDIKILNFIRKKQIPVCIILTKVDTLGKEHLEEFTRVVGYKCPEISIFYFSTELPEDLEAYVQKKEIVAWSLAHLDESLKAGFLSSIKGGLKEKFHYVNTTIVPGRAVAATVAVVSNNLIDPIPFTDSAILMGIQSEMMLKIFKTYGLDGDLKNIVKELAGTSVVSYLGRTVSTQIIGIIPFVGNAAKVVVNTTTAATITASLGLGISVLTKNYLDKCIDTDGKAKITFLDYFSGDRLKEAIRYVRDNESKFHLQQIIDSSVKKGEKN